MNDVTTQAQVLGITAEPTSLSLDEIQEAQPIDDNLQLVIQALVNKVKPPQGSLCDYPEEAGTLFSQWDSLVLEEDILYRRYHYPDGTTKYLQMVLPVKLRCLYVERLHADLGHQLGHCLYHLLPPKTSVYCPYSLCKRQRSYQLPHIEFSQHKNSFINRCLFKFR